MWTFIKSEKIFLTLLLSIHAIYFIYALTNGNIYTNDSDEYLETAYNLKNHNVVYNYFWTADKLPELYSLRPPVYGIFILAIKSIYNSDFFVVFMQNIISIFIWIYILFLLKKWEIELKLKAIIIITLLLFPAQLILVNSIMADLLLQFWIVLSLASLIYYFRTQKLQYIILYNLILVVAVFTKPVLMYFWIPNLFFSLYLFSTKKNIIILAATLFLPLSIFLWSLRNEEKTGYFHFSSIKTQNILDLNAGAVLTFLNGEDEAAKTKNNILEEADLIKNYKLKSEFITSESVKIIKENAIVYLYTHVKGMFNFMLATGRIDMVNFFRDKPKEEISIVRELEKNGLDGAKYYFQNVNLFLVFYMFFILLWNIVLLAGTTTFYFYNPIQPAIKIFILLIIAYTCFVCGSGGYARLKMCLLPLMMITVPFFINTLTHKINRLRKRNI